MGEVMNGSEYARMACRAGMCCLVVLSVTESHAAGGAISGHAGWRAALRESFIPIAAESTLTFSVRDIEAEPGTDSPIAINLPSSDELHAAGAETGAYLLIRNIPEDVSIAPGAAAKRVRVVPLRDAPILRLVSKPGMNAQFELEFLVMNAHNRLLARATANVNLRPREAPTAAIQISPMHEPTAAVQAAPKVGQLTPAAEALLLARGKDILKQGGIAAARIIFGELAAYGSATGAFALAQTYDPARLVPADAPAPPPSLAEARKWYERAAELGNPDAKRRLAEINSTR
jgi:hypothetical protein